VTAPNYLATVTLRLDVPGDRAEQIVGRPDDRSAEWTKALERALSESPDYLGEFANAEAEVEVV
jgi:hypothetical protein